MFSKRCAGAIAPNRISRLLQRLRREGVSPRDLTLSNPTQAGLSYPGAAILQALADPRSLRYEPSAAGLPEARQAVRNYYGERGVEVDPEDLFLTSGTSEGYSYLFKLLADPGGRVLVPEPSYPLLEDLAALEGLQANGYPLVRGTHWHIDLDTLAGRMKGARALVVVNPNNPTGSYLRSSQWVQLAELCLRYEVPLICDEVFFDYPLEGTPGADPARQQEVPCFVLNGLSKLAGLPQVKVSWILLKGPPLFREQARQRLEVVADAYLGVATPAQWALPRLLEAGRHIRRLILQRLQDNLKELLEQLSGSCLQVLPLEGGWYAVLRLPRLLTDEEWALRILQRAHVLTHPGYLFRFQEEGLLVLSLLPPPEVFRPGVAALKRAVQETVGEA